MLYDRFKTLSICIVSLIMLVGASVEAQPFTKSESGIQYEQSTNRHWDNGLAQMPPMGWNSWNHFGCNINEDIIKQTADALVQSGMKDAGYEYVVMDDCWMDDHRDKDGRLTSNPKRFPHGIKWLADYVHSKGLKLGIYSSAGTKTCQGLPASLDHETMDAQTFAEWDIDYLKYDNCYNQDRPLEERYTAMHKALKTVDRSIVYSICEWGFKNPWEWAGELGNLWRTTGDIRDTWNSMTDILDQQVGLYKYAGPGHWNDPDMLEVGNGGMTNTEYRAHFSLWAILNAPLMAGNDIRHMSDETKGILTNKEVIAVNQDPAGNQGHKIADRGEQEVWTKKMSDGSVAVVLFNRAKDQTFMTTDVKKVGLPEATNYKIRDLWQHKDYNTENLIRARVPAHGVRMYRISPS